MGMNAAHRIASRYFEERYARLLVSMSLEQAKVTLGFPPYANPTPEEISKAWRSKAFENHPDRGGSHEKMVEVNVAKDILQGKGTADRWRPEPPPPRPRPEPPKVVDTVPGQSWSAAAGSIPTGVDWKFVSKPEWAAHAKDNNASGGYIWVVVGVKDEKFVAVGVKHRKPDKLWDHAKGGLVEYGEDWQCNVSVVPGNRPAVKVVPGLIKGVSLLWTDGTNADAPKKFMLWPEGTKLTDDTIQKIKFGGGGVPLKDILLGAGMIADTDKSVAGRKTQVELRFKYSREKRERVMKTNPSKSVFVMWNYDVFVSVNGREVQLADDTCENLGKTFFGWAMPWEAVSDGNVRSVTKLKGSRFKGGAAYALRKLADALTSEPSWLIIALEKAAEEWEPEDKTAAMFRLASQMPLSHVAEAYGMNLYDLCATLQG